MKFGRIIVFVFAMTCFFVFPKAWAETVVSSGEEEPFIYDDHGRRDPLWPLVDSNGIVINYESDFVVTDLMLDGVMVSAQGDSLAIINGRIVKPNDMIGQFTVSSIGANSVVLIKGDQEFELKLKKEE